MKGVLPRRLGACACALLAAALLAGCTGQQQEAQPYSLPPAEEFAATVDEGVALDTGEMGFESSFLAYRYPGEWGDIPFRLYLPPEYAEADGPLPLFVYLHGMGQGGDDNTGQLDSAVIQHLLQPQNGDAPHPCIILAPQCPDDSMWYGLGISQTTLALIQQLMESLPVDADRVYLVGVSMGGMGVYSFLNSQPQLFAGAMSICGTPAVFGIAETISHVPLWAFHAADDDVVPVGDTRRLMEELTALGAPVQYTEYESGGHMIWDTALADGTAYEWLFSQRREGAQ